MDELPEDLHPHRRDQPVTALSAAKITELFTHASTAELIAQAGEVCRLVHGRQVLARGLIEFTNFCENDCLYCGIRRGNRQVNRYRIDEAAILAVVEAGYRWGFRSFVLQGGEDPAYTTARICRLVEGIKGGGRGDAAVTLSCGIRSCAEYRQMAQAGADRYLLRFETADPRHHFALRRWPLAARLQALADLRDAGFQLGSGFMLGLPGEKVETPLANILLCQSLELDMVGIGPFIPHPDTPLRRARQRPLEPVIRSLALLRLALPYAHLPATTAAGSLVADGREQMLAAGANVLMPNLTPSAWKRDYALYPNKVCLVEKGLEGMAILAEQLRPLGRELSFGRGDALRPTRRS